MSKRPQSRELYDFGGFCLDVTERALTKDGQIVPLTPKAFETLVALLRNSGQVVEKDELLKGVWADTFVEEGVLAVNVAAIRKALGDSAEGHSYIETVPRRGYRFVGEVHTPRGLSEIEDVLQKPGAQRSSIRLRAIGVGLIAFVAAALGWYFFRSRPTPLESSLAPVPLTSYPGTELSPTFSPDGNQVAFSWDGERQDNFDIYVKLVGRSDAMRLTSDPARDSSPAWSPDGRDIAFVRDGSVFLISPLGGPERRVGELHAHHIAWTRDSKSLVVSAGDLNKRRLRLVSVETGEGKELTTPLFGEDPNSNEEAPAVSPNGDNLVFVRQLSFNADLYLLPLAGGKPRRLTQDEGHIFGVTWTADGREVVYAGSTMALWRRSVEMRAGSASKRIEGLEPSVFGPVVSSPAPGLAPRLAYALPVFDTNIWVRETTESSPARRLVASTRGDDNPQFSPDGRKLAFRTSRSGIGQIWVANSDGSNPLQLTFLPDGKTNAPRWAPDGKHIVFASMQNKNRDIFSVSSEGGSLRRLTSAPSREGRPSWSRDGRWIYFFSARGGREEIWRIPAQGGEPIQLTTGGGHESFESPDGKLLYYEDYGVKGLRSISIETYSGPQEGSVVLGSVQPGFWAVTEKGIYFVEFNDRQTATSNFIYALSEAVVSSASQQIKVYDFRTRKVTKIGTIEKPLVRGDIGLSATWDGSTIAWSQIDRRESDLMMIENFR